LTHPFLHGGLGHLISNSIGILTLGTLVAAHGRGRWALITLVATLLGGLGIWLIGASGSNHIGASGVVFAYFGYLLTAGLFERRFGSILLSVVVLLLWGGMIFGVLPGQVGISWEGHLFGFLAGVLMARVLARRERD
ncbi:MAG: rhomboid family intramembrane serine protease, partial [Myxococcales bacterium]|nr:rhomboid family intramembrane serine protease [Myxococcales bacterium]